MNPAELHSVDVVFTLVLFISPGTTMLASLALVTLAASTLATPLDAGTLEARQAARTGVIVPGLVCGSNPLVAAGVRALDSGSYKIGDGENLFLSARFHSWLFSC